MTSLTERYVAAALRGIPERQRDDVGRELRSSIVDAVDDRVASGEDREAAETAVLEELGDPALLSAGLVGRPLYLIGPDLFMYYRTILVRLLGIVVPIVAIVLAAVTLSRGDGVLEAIFEGAGVGFTVAVYIVFWVTVFFALIERFDTERTAQKELREEFGTWTVERLPSGPPGRVGLGETVGEVVTAVLTIGGLLVAQSITFPDETSGVEISLLAPDLWAIWVPVLIAILAVLAALHIVIYRVGRWTVPLAVAHTLLEVAFAAPMVYLALNGTLVNPAFADAVGWPPLAEASGPVMVWVAVGVVLVTAWEIVDAFRKAWRARPVTPP